MLELHARFELREVRFDPYQMQASAQRLQRAGVPMVEFPQSVPNLTEASNNLYELIKGRGLAVYPDADMRLSVSRAVALETSRGWKIAKEKVSHKIDVVVALAQAALGAVLDQQLEPPIIAFYRQQVLRRDDPEHHPEPPNELLEEYERTMKEIAEAEDAARGVRHIENVSSGSPPAGGVSPSMGALALRILGR
jgi:hypothetical protein